MTSVTTLVLGWVVAHRVLLLSIAAAVAVLLMVLAAKRTRAGRHTAPVTDEQRASRANLGYYFSGALGIALSADTSFRFFGDKLHIVGIERVGMFALIEVGLLACAYGMRTNVRRKTPEGEPASPGTARMIAWALCGFAAYAALVEAGPVEGLARVLAGPVFAMVMLHQALGIEIHNRHGRSKKKSTWARVADEMRERALSRIGLADDARDAAARTRDRALMQAARLATASKRTPFRQSRLERAVIKAGVADDDTLMIRLVNHIGVIQHAQDLASIRQPSPYAVATKQAKVVAPTAKPKPAPAPLATPPAAAPAAAAARASEQTAEINLEGTPRPVLDLTLVRKYGEKSAEAVARWLASYQANPDNPLSYRAVDVAMSGSYTGTAKNAISRYFRDFGDPRQQDRGQAKGVG
jgi:hypothetical protein